MKNKNKKDALILIMLVAIIIILFAGIIYQFVIIKTLQNEISNLKSCFQPLIKFGWWQAKNLINKVD